MKVGISLTSGHVAKDVRAAARWMVERTAAARKAELDSLFVGDHHATPGLYYQNTPILGRLLAEWGSMPAGCLFLLPLWHPTLLAEQVGTLAAIGGGRFIFQCGLGDGEAQFAAMGARVKSRVRAFEESLDIVRRLLAGETVSSSGCFELREAKVALRPPEPVEYWIGASADPAIDRAARLADGWLASPSLTPEEARRQAAYYLERCVHHGRKPAAVALRRDIYVGGSQKDADEVAGAAVAAGYRGFSPRALVHGTAEAVANQFRAYGEMGYTDIIVRHFINDQPKVLGSLAQLADVRRRLT